MLLNCGVGEDSLESLGLQEIKPINPERNQSWIFIERTDGEAKAPILWPPDGTSWLIRKDPDAGKDWGQEKKGMTEDEMVGWHHWFNVHEFEQALGDSEDGEVWRAAVHGVAKSRIRLSDWTSATALNTPCAPEVSHLSAPLSSSPPGYPS